MNFFCANLKSCTEILTKTPLSSVLQRNFITLNLLFNSDGQVLLKEKDVKDLFYKSKF